MVSTIAKDSNITKTEIKRIFDRVDEDKMVGKDAKERMLEVLNHVASELAYEASRYTTEAGRKTVKAEQIEAATRSVLSNATAEEVAE